MAQEGCPARLVTFVFTVPESNGYQNKCLGCGKRLLPVWLPLKQTELTAFNPQGELHGKQPSQKLGVCTGVQIFLLGK